MAVCRSGSDGTVRNNGVTVCQWVIHHTGNNLRWYGYGPVCKAVKPATNAIMNVLYLINTIEGTV